MGFGGNYTKNWPAILFAVLFLSSCSVTKRLQEDEFMLVNNRVKILNPSKEVSVSELNGLIQQKPNKRLFGFIPFKLWMNAINKKWGEPPVVFDLSLSNISIEQMGKYLNNAGFFNSSINYKVDYKKKKAKRVNYFIQLSEPYTIRNFKYTISDDSIRELVESNIEESLIHEGAIYNSYTFDKERSRISSHLRNQGYFSFSKDFIYFEIDSALSNRQMDVNLIVENVVIPSDDPQGEEIHENHKIYYINNVFIQPDFKTFQSDTIAFDTIVEEVSRKGLPLPNKYHFVYTPPLKIKPKVVTRSMFIEEGEKFNATDVNQSYKTLTNLYVYKYVSINFTKSPFSEDNDPDKNFLDCNVQLIRNPVHSYSIEAQGTNSGGDLGIGGYLVYQNKNLFRGGEVFYIRLKGALEAQDGGTVSEEDQSRKFLFFNTYEAGIEANLTIPKFLAPINQDLFSRYFRPKTTINLGYNIQDRIEYRRIITNLSFGYDWSVSKNVNHVLFPADINLVKVNTTPEFDSILADESERFRNQYTDNLIIGLRYSYIFNNQDLNKIKNFMYFRTNVESAGNLLDLIVNAANAPVNDEGYQTVFGIRYAQYVRFDFDYRYYVMLERAHAVAFRAFTGLAIPYGNSIDIPFEKGYYGGGANGLRAWPLRYLGPGSFAVQPGDNNLERVGDIQLEANVEYRFPIFKFFKGALFYDVGNIWLLSENETFPGGKFYFDKFLSELAMDFGLGVRLDFNYFIFRIDFAQRLRDPALPEDDRWVVGTNKGWFDPIMNLGIGYPF